MGLGGTCTRRHRVRGVGCFFWPLRVLSLARSLTRSLTHSRSLSLAIFLSVSSAIAISDVLKKRSLKDGPMGEVRTRQRRVTRFIRGACLFWPLRMLSHTHSTALFLSVLFSQGGLRWACLLRPLSYSRRLFLFCLVSGHLPSRFWGFIPGRSGRAGM